MAKSIYDRPAVIKRLRFGEGRRILVVSDIHGNFEYFKGVLDAVGFNEDDELIIDGDFLEKGQSSLKLLRYIMELSKTGNVHTVMGNCDDWFNIFNTTPEGDEELMQYILRKKSGILWEMCEEGGIDPFETESFTQCKRALFMGFLDEWRFLSALPHAIETEKFIFAHAAVDPSKSLDRHTADELVRCDYFLRTGRSFKKWVIVGHMPVMLYNSDKVCANPIIDREKKIISIDGGCVLKDDGQLNCLIIPDKYSEDFSYVAYDAFPSCVAMDAQEEGKNSYYVAWSDSRVQVLERGEEFSRCRHVSTGYELDILTKYLFSDNEYTNCNDCTDYILPIKPGDIVKLVETSSRGYFIKHKGISGWYFGRLERI